MTEEQQLIVDTIVSDTQGKVVTVNAVAGAGKTTTSLAVAKAINPKQGFYTAFNRAIVKDSNKKFNNLMDVKTIHSLAHQYIKPSRLDNFTYDRITEKIPYQVKKNVIDTLDDFFRSSALCYEEYFENRYSEAVIEDLVIKYANKMYSGKIPSTHNYNLKCLHLMLHEKSINPKFDLFIFDEFQDVTPVSLEIFKLIDSKKKIAFGDKHQNIYGFLNTVNGFDLLEDTINLSLTKSFRCNEEVAKEVETFGKQSFGKDFIFTGNDQLRDSYDPKEKVYLSRTNSQLIYIMHDLIKEGQGFSLVRSLDEVFALPFAIVTLAAGKPLYGNDFKFLEYERRQWANSPKKNTFINYLKSLELEEVTSAINILQTLFKKGINIFDLKEQLKKVKPNKDVVLSTAHAYKGLEKSVVMIDNNLTQSVTGDSVLTEDKNVYYVALSRAKHKIIKM